jgi:predicted phosphohydrolase
MNLSKFLWYTDLHLDKLTPWKKHSFLKLLKKEESTGLILTGDISNGKQICNDLQLIAEFIECPVYFVLGNHDYHWSSLQEIHEKIRNLCVKFPNLIWMTYSGVLHINEEVAFIGIEGWYDAENGNSQYLKLTPDWFLIEEFRNQLNMEARIAIWRKLAQLSADQMANHLERAIEQKYKSIYLLTHYPPWTSATRDVGTLLEKFWLPYNCNLHLGRAIEKVMEHHKKRHVTVLCGHTHTPVDIRISRNIECRVGPGHYFGVPKTDQQIIFL